MLTDKRGGGDSDDGLAGIRCLLGEAFGLSAGHARLE